MPFAAAGPGHLVEGRPDVAVGLMEGVVGVAAMLVPEAGAGDVESGAALLEAVDVLGEVFGEAGADLAGHEARDAGAGGLLRSGG